MNEDSIEFHVCAFAVYNEMSIVTFIPHRILSIVNGKLNILQCGCDTLNNGIPKNHPID